MRPESGLGHLTRQPDLTAVNGPVPGADGTILSPEPAEFRVANGVGSERQHKGLNVIVDRLRFRHANEIVGAVQISDQLVQRLAEEEQAVVDENDPLGIRKMRLDILNAILVAAEIAADILPLDQDAALF